MSQQLAGKVAIVTGSGAGIGREVAVTLAAAGATVVVSDISEEAGRQTVSLAGERAHFIRTDVADPESVNSLVRETVERFGSLDIAHNNAGIPGKLALLADVSPDDWQRVVSINLSGVFYCMQAELRAMLTRGNGSIINTASVLGLGAIPHQSPYVATKHGVLGLTKAAAVEYAKQGIRVNAVLPGPVQTQLIEDVEKENPGYIEKLTSFVPAGRLAQPSDVAKAVLWLASDETPFVTGACISVDGGVTAHA